MSEAVSSQRILFNRRELAGAFGDIGTDLPLLAAMIVAAGLHAPWVFILFGLLQVATGLLYRIPMPVQPLKAMAALVISQKLGGDVLMAAGLSIGVVMLILSLSGTLDAIARLVPKAVVRGLQFGLGMSLSLLACKEYIPAHQTAGYVLAGISFVVLFWLKDHVRYPGALIVIAMGFVYALFFQPDTANAMAQASRDWAIHFSLPDQDTLIKGFVLLALPQIPLSLGNSILATRQLATDLFPERNISIRRIGLTYSLMNLVTPALGGIPVCHGSGGMAGHYAFGGRSGGSVIIYGGIYVLIGLFFAFNVPSVLTVFPMPMLGVILLFEGLSLVQLMRDMFEDQRLLFISILTGVLAVGLPYGFLIALVIGTAVYYLPPGSVKSQPLS